jgi:hypothetical protein
MWLNAELRREDGKNIRYKTGICDHHLGRTDSAANPGVLTRQCYFL